MMTQQQYLLVKLAEELSEAAVVALKCAHFGLLQSHPELSQNNYQRLQEELVDVQGVSSMLHDSLSDEEASFDFSADELDQKFQAKIAKVEKYRAMSVDWGLVDE